MDLLHKIQDAKSLAELDSLREEIHLASSYGEIDFKVAKQMFLARKQELEGKVKKYELNWII